MTPKHTPGLTQEKKMERKEWTPKQRATYRGMEYAAKRLAELFPAYAYDRSFFATSASWEDAATMKGEAPADPDEARGFLVALGYILGDCA